MSFMNSDFQSALFLRKESTIVMPFVSVFFDTPEVTKIVLPKVIQNFKVIHNCTRWPRELNEKGFFSFFSA